jgi:hypothetical protein
VFQSAPSSHSGRLFLSEEPVKLHPILNHPKIARQFRNLAQLMPLVSDGAHDERVVEGDDSFDGW